jgi:dihydrofolate synthase/folylpolyglutamate synthase
VASGLQRRIESLYGLERHKEKLGLDGTRALLAALGDPQRRFRVVHVAGTNGKGSTCALIERALRATGARTGLFTSPHLVEFRERIRVNGQWADDEGLERILARLDRLPGIDARTFFEVVTALGFAWFAEHGVEWAVVEVGLGGRLDCTNVVEPDVTVITSVGLDHTEILGDTIEAIAAEKAGIAKPGVPLVLAPGLDPAARAVIEAIAAGRGAPVLLARDAAPGTTDAGDFRGGTNAAAAAAALEALAGRGAIPRAALDPERMARAFAAAHWPGRFEMAPDAPGLWWDGAHNVQGLVALGALWRTRGLPPPGAVALALSRDKDAAGMLGALAGFAPDATIVATPFAGGRARPAEEIADAARALGGTAETAPDVATACRRAVALAASGPALLTGSLFAVGEAMQAFGGAPSEWQ